MLGNRREIGTLLGKDSAMRLAHVRLDSGRELVLDWLEVEQQGIMNETGEMWDEWKDFQRRAMERDGLMQAFESDRDRGTGQDASEVD